MCHPREEQLCSPGLSTQSTGSLHASSLGGLRGAQLFATEPKPTVPPLQGTRITERKRGKTQRASFLGSPRFGRSGAKLHSHRDSDSMLLDIRDSTRKHLPSQPADLPMNQLRFIFKHPGGNGKQGTCRQPPAAPQHTHTGLLHPKFASRAIPGGVTT